MSATGHNAKRHVATSEPDVRGWNNVANVGTDGTTGQDGPVLWEGFDCQKVLPTLPEGPRRGGLASSRKPRVTSEKSQNTQV